MKKVVWCLPLLKPANYDHVTMHFPSSLERIENDKRISQAILLHATLKQKIIQF